MKNDYTYEMYFQGKKIIIRILNYEKKGLFNNEISFRLSLSCCDVNKKGHECYATVYTEIKQIDKSDKKIFYEDCKSPKEVYMTDKEIFLNNNIKGKEKLRLRIDFSNLESEYDDKGNYYPEYKDATLYIKLRKKPEFIEV